MSDIFPDHGIRRLRPHPVGGQTKTYLDVPYSNKDQAKALGARWDNDAKKWYVPENMDPKLFGSWLGSAPMTIELVPESAWYKNVRANVTPEEWDMIRRSVYREFGYNCNICGGKGPEHPVEAHEKWRFEKGADGQPNWQILDNIVALCPDCHEVKHIGLAELNGRGNEAAERLAMLNNWTIGQAEVYLNNQFNTWEQRGRMEWQLEISLLLKKYGIRNELTKTDSKRQYIYGGYLNER